MTLKNDSKMKKIIILTILFNILSGCFFKNSSQSKIEELVKGPIKDKLYLKDTKFNSIKIIADGSTNNSKSTDITMEHLWQLHVIAEETIIFSGERRRTFNCIGIGTNKDIDTVRILSVNQCPETNTDKDIADAKKLFKKIINDFNELK